MGEILEDDLRQELLNRDYSEKQIREIITIVDANHAYEEEMGTWNET